MGIPWEAVLKLQILEMNEAAVLALAFDQKTSEVRSKAEWMEVHFLNRFKLTLM